MTFWKTVFAFVCLPLYFGGSSKSSTATTTNYTTTDDRIAAAEGAVVTQLRLGANSDVAGVVAKGNNNTITTADPQIVKEAFAYARERDALAGESLQRVLSSASEVVSQQAGKFSERTIIILAAAGIALLYFMRRGRA